MLSDEGIIDSVLKGNTQIFSEIVNRYKDKVFSMVYRFTNDYSETQDLSQEVFISVFKNLYTFNNKSKFSTWLYRVCYNLCIDWCRKSRNSKKQIFTGEEIPDVVNEEFNLEEDFISRQKRGLIRSAVNDLDEKYKTVVILFHYQGLSYEDIGEILKLPVKTVETRLYRARNLLKKNLSHYYKGGEFYEVQAGS